MSRELKVGDRVKIIISNEGLGVKTGDKATLMNIKGDGMHKWFSVNTDKLNCFNLPGHNGNGLELLRTSLELLLTGGKWSKSEVDYLHTYYRRKSVTELAEHLKRSYYSVQSKARSEGIHKHPRRDYNSTDTHFIIHQRIDKVSINLIGHKLHRSKSSIGSRFNLMVKQGIVPTFTTIR